MLVAAIVSGFEASKSVNTPAHLIFGLAVFGRKPAPGVVPAALIGAILPDVSLYVMCGWALLVSGIEPNIVFGQMYYSQPWQRVFAIDNSFILWGIALAFAIWSRKAAAIALCGAALLHIGLDFPVHNHDARMHFWPASDWVFISPLSYWDRTYHAGVIGPTELVFAMAMLVVLWRRFRGFLARAGLVILGALELMAGGAFSLIF